MRISLKKIFLDTETSGFKPGQIAQLTYTITIDDKVEVAKNFFLACDYIDPGAEKVHGFSVDKLKYYQVEKPLKILLQRLQMI